MSLGNAQVDSLFMSSVNLVQYPNLMWTFLQRNHVTAPTAACLGHGSSYISRCRQVAYAACASPESVISRCSHPALLPVCSVCLSLSDPYSKTALHSLILSLSSSPSPNNPLAQTLLLLVRIPWKAPKVPTLPRFILSPWLRKCRLISFTVFLGPSFFNFSLPAFLVHPLSVWNVH